MARTQSERMLFSRIERQGDWPEQGACREVDPDLWFPEQGDRAANHAAKEICAWCPVMTECRQWALDSREPYGVWGGMSARERRSVWRAAA